MSIYELPPVTAPAQMSSSKTRSLGDWQTHLGCAAVVLCLCLPLFGGLDRWDLQNDEAIYSYAVDRMVDGAGWGTPKSSPNDGPFLEKPPLKFWMVAAPINWGLLPHDEVGLRFMDAMLGAASLLYVYYFGVRLAGVVCGAVAALVLFTFHPLLFEHGLRSNNMEAAQLLCHAGGLYHFARWVEPVTRAGARGHALAVAAYFTLGFMTKFVAAIFLPLICLVAIASWPEAWRRVRLGWRDWIAPTLLAVAAIAPWFIYQMGLLGDQVWRVMLGEHVYRRFTASLDPQHLEPWDFYYVQTWPHLTRAGTAWLVVAGLVTLAIAAWRGRTWLPRLILVWGLVPPALLSLGTSKLYHYIYPFLPPLALAAGLVAAVWLDAFRRHATPLLAAWLPDPLQNRDTRLVLRARRALAVAAAATFALVVWTIASGTMHIDVGGETIFRNSSLGRPLVAGAVFLWLAGQQRALVRTLAVLPLVVLLPFDAYRGTLRFTQDVAHPLKAIRDCGVRLRTSGADVGDGFYNAASDRVYHSYFYYLRHLGPWVEARHPQPDELNRRLHAPGEQTPVLMSQRDYNDRAMAVSRASLSAATSSARAPSAGITINDGIVVLLPGPYEACVPPAVEAGAKQATGRGGAS